MLKYFFYCIGVCFLSPGTQAFALIKGNEKIVSERTMLFLSESGQEIIHTSLILAAIALLLFCSIIFIKILKVVKKLPVIESSMEKPLDLQTLSETEKKEIFSKCKRPISITEKALSQNDRKKFIQQMVSGFLFNILMSGTLFFTGSFLIIYLFINLFVIPINLDPVDIACYIILGLSFILGSLLLFSVGIKQDLSFLKANPYFPYQKALKAKYIVSLKQLFLLYKNRKK